TECEPCGHSGEPCCDTLPWCLDASESCIATGPLQFCSSTTPGSPGQSGRPCMANPLGACIDPTFICVTGSMSPFCLVCGELSNPCCDGMTCHNGFQCQAGACTQ